MLQIRFILTLGLKSKFGKGNKMVDFPDTHEDVNCQNMETKVNLISLSWRGDQVWSWVNCPFKWDICRISKYWRSQSFLTDFLLFLEDGTVLGVEVTQQQFVISLGIYWKINLPPALFVHWEGVISHQWVCCQKVL